MRRVHGLAAVALAAGFCAEFSGCGTPGAPQPPSLNLPDRVGDLEAVRAGGQVTLTWTMPKRNTDKLPIKGLITSRICHSEAAGACEDAGKVVMLKPGAEARFTETLPASLTTGKPRTVSYFVELKNQRGRSAGLSNAAKVLAGEAPAPVNGLTAEVRKAGVVVRWAGTDSTPVRLCRRLLLSAPKTRNQGVLEPEPEAVEQNLLVENNAQEGRALDRQVRFGQAYEYRAQRVARVTVEGKTLELAGALSAPIRVEVADTFPPGTPTEPAAVAVAADNGEEAAIDLSWQPVTDTDVVGYIVYRREADSPWQRISPAQPVAGPAFHDASVQPGHTYTYAVSAVDQGGHESARSAETRETVPTP